MLVASPAQAGIVFTPHLSEYQKLSRGFYFEGIVFYNSIDKVFDEKGNREALNGGTLKGEKVEVILNTYKFLWVTNPFRHTNVPILHDHDLFLRVVGGVGWQRSTRGAVANNSSFGLDSSAAGLADLFPLVGMYTKEHVWGPVQVNGLLAGVAKIPFGQYASDSALNIGTNYWSLMPLLAAHQTLYGRLFVDSVASYQFNFDDPRPAAGGLVPSEPADIFTLESNLAWKFSEHFYAEFGPVYSQSVGPNVFSKVTISNKEPVAATGTQFPKIFFIRPQPGRYRDDGIASLLLSSGLYYVYRTSLVFNFRVYYPLLGRGSVFNVPFDVATSPNGPSVATVSADLPGVSEAASVPATPLFEFRLVYLPWAP